MPALAALLPPARLCASASLAPRQALVARSPLAPPPCVALRRRCGVSVHASSARDAKLQLESWQDVFDEAEDENEAAAASAVAKTSDVPRNTNRVFLVGLSLKEQPRARGATLSIEDSLLELAQLAETAGLEVAGGKSAPNRLGHRLHSTR
jgi:hypothetical protein